MLQFMPKKSTYNLDNIKKSLVYQRLGGQPLIMRRSRWKFCQAGDQIPEFD